MTIYLVKTTTSLADKAFKNYEMAKDYLNYCKDCVIQGCPSLENNVKEAPAFWAIIAENDSLVATGEIDHIEYVTDNEEYRL